MDLVETMRALGRRWYVLLTGMLLTGGLVYGTLNVVPLTYDVQASLLLMPPADSPANNGNPFLNLGGLDVVAGVLTKSLTDESSGAVIAPHGSDAKYEVAVDATVPGSVLAVTATDITPRGALAVLGRVQSLAESKLSDLQADAGSAANDRVHLMVITSNETPTPDYSSLLRPLLVVIAGGIVVSLLCTVAVDALIRSRRLRTAARPKVRTLDPVVEVVRASAASRS
jgi:hypothetical protein